MENSVNNCNYFFFVKRWLRRVCNAIKMSDKIKFTSYNDVNKVANEIFELLFSK